MSNTFELDKIPLGRSVEYPTAYNPTLLFSIARDYKRLAYGILEPFPFDGVDIWNAYEVSWLEERTRKPRVAVAEIYVPCKSPNLVESKSLKLYLNSLNQSIFKNETEIKATLQRDLAQAVGCPVRVNLALPPFNSLNSMHEFSGIYLDDLPVQIATYTPEPELLSTSGDTIVEEKLYSNLLKSNCAVTLQPDWATLYIHYEGQKINRVNLLKYIVSYREHNDFHEQCIERIFVDIIRQCKPTKLTVYARYTRRGGIDINPFRSNFQSMPLNIRNFRQ